MDRSSRFRDQGNSCRRGAPSGANHAERLWTLVNFELWQRHFLDGEPLKGAPAADRGSTGQEASPRIPLIFVMRVLTPNI
jgi:hypothetical protein